MIREFSIVWNERDMLLSGLANTDCCRLLGSSCR